MNLFFIVNFGYLLCVSIFPNELFISISPKTLTYVIAYASSFLTNIVSVAITLLAEITLIEKNLSVLVPIETASVLDAFATRELPIFSVSGKIAAVTIVLSGFLYLMLTKVGVNLHQTHS